MTNISQEFIENLVRENDQTEELSQINADSQINATIISTEKESTKSTLEKAHPIATPLENKSSIIKACLNCNKRHRKCNRTQPICGPCVIRGLKCQWHSENLPVKNSIETLQENLASETQKMNLKRKNNENNGLDELSKALQTETSAMKESQAIPQKRKVSNSCSSTRKIASKKQCNVSNPNRPLKGLDEKLQFRIPSIKSISQYHIPSTYNQLLTSPLGFYPLLSSLNIDTTALELYEYVKIKYDPIELLSCLKVFMEMDSNKINLEIIKILTFQIIENINCFQISLVDQLIDCCVNIYKYQTHHHKDSIGIINFKNQCCTKIMRKLSSLDVVLFHEALLTSICLYLKILISLMDLNYSFLKRYSKHAFMEFYINERYNFTASTKARTIKSLIKEFKYDVESLKRVIKGLFKRLITFKPNVLKINENKLNKYKQLHIFIDASLIIINDIDLLKCFKNLKLEWIHKSW